jgi:hypothetical protein
MAKVMKKAQTGKNVPKGMVESEMFPGKMILKSKSNYENSNYDKMLGAKKAPAAKPKAKAKVVVKPKAKNGKIIKKAQSGLRESLFKRGREAVATPSKQINKYATDERNKKWERQWEENEGWLEDPKKSSLPGLVQEMKDYKAANEWPLPPGEYYDNATNSYKKYPKKPEISYVKMLKDTGGYQRSGGKTSKTKITKPKMKSGGMLKRADGSYSKRGLWDNIRAAKGSGKKPTAAMLKQEKKIKAKTK